MYGDWTLLQVKARTVSRNIQSSSESVITIRKKFFRGESQMKKKDEIKVCLVGSSGGHLTHLYMLKPFWKDKNRFWVTFDKEDARSLLEGEKVYPCYFPTLT